MKRLLLVIIGFCFIPAFSSGQNPVPIDTLRQANGRFLVFPFFLRSPETNWGFGGASAYFFKLDPKDSIIRTSDINLLGLYTLNEQVVFWLNSNIFFPGEDRFSAYRVPTVTTPINSGASAMKPIIRPGKITA